MAKQRSLMFYISELVVSDIKREDFILEHPDPVLIEVSANKLTLPKNLTKKTTRPNLDRIASRTSSAVLNPDGINVLSVGPYGDHSFKGMLIYAGRGRDMDIVIKDEHISRHHARFKESDGLWYIIDESTNGTYINSRRLEHKVEYELKPGDKIAFGTSSFYEFYLAKDFWGYLNFRAGMLKSQMEE